MRLCELCNTPLQKRKGESRNVFGRRKYCSTDCRIAAISKIKPRTRTRGIKGGQLSVLSFQFLTGNKNIEKVMNNIEFGSWDLYDKI